MKIDFYDLFSLHTPEEFPEEGTDNYTAAAVKSRVMDNISENKRKPVRISRIGKIFLSAAAAAVVLVTGTLAASAMGLIDLDKAFGRFFNGNTEHMDGISAIPQNVVTTGDDSLSMSVLGIGGADNEALIAIEIKRNDGGTFPEYIYTREKNIDVGNAFIVTTTPEVTDDSTATLIFTVYSGGDEKIVGKDCTIEIEDILGRTDERTEETVLKGKWSISFPLEYNSEYRTKEIHERIVQSEMSPPAIMTKIGYSPISLNIYFNAYETYGMMLYDDIVINLDNGEQVKTSMGANSHYFYGEALAVCNYRFEKPIDIDKIESITIKDVEIPIK